MAYTCSLDCMNGLFINTASEARGEEVEEGVGINGA